MAAALPLLYVFSTGFQRIIFVLLLFWLLLLVRVDAQNRSTEVQTLLRFKSMTNADSAILSRGFWNTWKETAENPCAWWGVTCTANSTVWQLSFSGWGLTKLPSLGILSSLTDLRELDFSNNNFQSPPNIGVSIPDDIRSLVGITYLNLSNGPFSGPIPQNISACKNLQYISLENNLLTGEIPDLSGLAKLQYLYLSGNQLGGNFPKWLGQINSLLAVQLMQNAFGGTIPSLSNLTSLLEVQLDGNSFTGFEEPLFPDAASLEELTVSNNQLQGPIPPSITKFLNMRLLDLSNNQLSGPIPSGFSINVSQGAWMKLDRNQLIGSIPENLLQTSPAQAINLPGLNFSNNLLTGQIPFHATNHYYYDTIDFSNNNLSGPIPSICSNGNSYFNHFRVQNNNLSGDIVDFLIACYDSITDLRLANNSFSGDLTRIANINSSSVDLNGLTAVWRGYNLQRGYRDLSNNNLQMSTTEANPDPLGATLEYFVLNTSVVQLRMQGNDFSGAALPPYLLAAANDLTYLDLSNNHLRGEISVTTFNSTWWPALQFLNLANNDIRGSVPEALVTLPNLATLDVANNRLSGALPTIPNTLYNPSFFEGNSGLCGGPGLKACSGEGVQWWIFVIIVSGAALTVLGSCAVVTWRYKVYHRMHKQDTDVIKALLEKESASLMSLRELSKATDNFADSARVGAGGFGTVYTGKLNDGSIVAIKRSKREGSEKDKTQFLNEVRILSQISHRHLVKLLGCCMENKIALLVFEFVSNGTLEEHLRRKIGVVHLSWKQRLRIAMQTADALNYLHSATTFPIYHRDVKSANILLDDNLNAKVADFGIAKLAPFEATHVSTVAVQGTIGYIDPEYYTTYQLSEKSDVYSFGVVLLELISAKPAIDFQRGGDQTGLVYFAKAHIESGNLQPMIDIALMDTYDNVAGNGRESILNVGRLAMKCVQMQSRARPTMTAVWKDLEKMWLDLDDTSKDSASFIDINDENKNPGRDEIALVDDPFSCNRSISSLRDNDATSIQMTPFSHLTSDQITQTMSTHRLDAVQSTRNVARGRVHAAWSMTGGVLIFVWPSDIIQNPMQNVHRSN